MSRGKHRKWHFRDPKFQNFLGGHAPIEVGCIFMYVPVCMCVYLQKCMLRPWVAKSSGSFSDFWNARLFICDICRTSRSTFTFHVNTTRKYFKLFLKPFCCSFSISYFIPFMFWNLYKYPTDHRFIQDKRPKTHKPIAGPDVQGACLRRSFHAFRMPCYPTQKNLLISNLQRFWLCVLYQFPHPFCLRSRTHSV